MMVSMRNEKKYLSIIIKYLLLCRALYLSLHGNCFGRNSDTLKVAIIKYNIVSFFRIIHQKSAEGKVDNSGQY